MTKSDTKGAQKIDCDSCEFNMPNNNGKMVCAGRDKEYGQLTPIKGVKYEECWEENFFLFIERKQKEEFCK